MVVPGRLRIYARGFAWPRPAVLGPLRTQLPFPLLCDWYPHCRFVDILAKILQHLSAFPRYPALKARHGN